MRELGRPDRGHARRAAVRHPAHPADAGDRDRLRRRVRGRYGLERSRYEGPTGIVGVLQDACVQAGIPAISFWAGRAALRVAAAEPEGDAGAAAPRRGRARRRRSRWASCRSRPRSGRSSSTRWPPRTRRSREYIRNLEERDDEIDRRDARGLRRRDRRASSSATCAGATAGGPGGRVRLGHGPTGGSRVAPAGAQSTTAGGGVADGHHGDGRPSSRSANRCSRPSFGVGRRAGSNARAARSPHRSRAASPACHQPRTGAQPPGTPTALVSFWRTDRAPHRRHVPAAVGQRSGDEPRRHRASAHGEPPGSCGGAARRPARPGKRPAPARQVVSGAVRSWRASGVGDSGCSGRASGRRPARPCDHGADAESSWSTPAGSTAAGRRSSRLQRGRPAAAAPTAGAGARRRAAAARPPATRFAGLRRRRGPAA